MKDTHTPRRTVRVDDDTWQRFATACRVEDRTPSDVLRTYMRRYSSRSEKRLRSAVGADVQSES